MNWRGKPLTSHEVMINLIAATTNKTGLKVRAKIDRNIYPSGVKITRAEMAKVGIEREAFHGEWNYQISPSNNHNV